MLHILEWACFSSNAHMDAHASVTDSLLTCFPQWYSDNNYIYIYMCMSISCSVLETDTYCINMLSVTHSRVFLSTITASTHHIPQVQWWPKGLYKLHSNSMLTAWCHLGLGALVQLLSVLLCACIIWTTWGTMTKADILGRSFLWKRERRTPAISYKTQHHLESRL